MREGEREMMEGGRALETHPLKVSAMHRLLIYV